MIIKKAYKFRLYPNKEQQDLINKTIGCCRFVYKKEELKNHIYYKKISDILKDDS